MSNLCAKCLTRIDEGRMYCKDCDDSARGMFEKLGYKLSDNGRYMMYRKRNWVIEIDRVLKTVACYIEDDFNTFGEIEYEELQAINKQVEELGWN